jgi:type II secretory ATPase GspE/PulE/Tfp pilus assembly ATPase PilB-like protein
MFSKLKGLFEKPSQRGAMRGGRDRNREPLTDGIARSPKADKQEGAAKRKERRVRSVAVQNDRRRIEEAAIAAPPIAIVAEFEEPQWLMTGTDSTVVPISTVRRSVAAVTNAIHEQDKSTPAMPEFPSTPTAPIAQPKSAPSASTSKWIADKTPQEPESATAPTVNVASEHDLMATLGRPWRGLLAGIVNDATANQLLPLDLQCGQVGILITEHMLKSSHWATVRKTIEGRGDKDWSYRITHICVATPAIVAAVYAKCSVATEHYSHAPLKFENAYLRVYDDIVEQAVVANASDIHFETNGSEGRVRLRVYGRLRSWLTLPKEQIIKCLGAAFGQRIKEQTNNTETLNAEKPTAFMTTQTVNGAQWEGRLNGRPHARGYKAVMRLLESTMRVSDIPTLEGLGYNASQRVMFDKALTRQWGLIIAIGPTGEGKSTTLRSMLVHLPGAENLATYSVESPVEYLIPNVTQINVPVDVNQDAEVIAKMFTGTLRDTMRMDPDVMMVGEVRDHETAVIAIEYTTTGHRCLTTLHGDGSVVGLARMAGGKMRIPADTLAGDTLINCCLYQKLLPKLCPHCKVSAHDPVNGLSMAKRAVLKNKYRLDTVSMFVANPTGCARCKPAIAGLDANGTKGVSVAAEIFMPTGEMRPLIAEKKWPEVTKLWRSQRTEDFSSPNMEGKTAYEHGLWLVANGIVALEHLEDKFETIESYEIFVPQAMRGTA